MKTHRSLIIKITVVILIMALVLPTNVFAAQARASDYLEAYSAYIYPAGWGKVQVWIEVDGTEDMDEIGALEVQLFESKDQENWTWVETYTYNDHDGMLAYDDFTHTTHVEYSGTIGRYYKAYVCVWAGKNGDGDTRYFWTNVEKATLFAG